MKDVVVALENATLNNVADEMRNNFTFSSFL